MRKLSSLESYAFIFVGYFLLGSIGTIFSTVEGFASPIWLASGFAFFCIIRFGASAFWIVLLASTAKNIIFGTPVWVSTVVGCGAALEALCARYIFLNLLYKKRSVLVHHSRLVGLITASAVGSAVSAIIGLGVLTLAKIAPEDQFFNGLLTWYGGDLLGNLLLTPLLIEMNKRWRSKVPFKPEELVISLFIALAFATILKFSPVAAFLLLVFPVILAVLSRWGSLTILLTINLIALICISSLSLRIGPFVLGPKAVNLTSCMVFLFTLGFTAYSLINFQKVQAIRQNRRFLFLVWIMAFGVGLISEVIFLKRDEARFQALVTSASTDLEKRLKDYERVLYGASAFFRASERVTRTDWKIFALDYDMINILPGFWGIGYIDIIPKKQFNSVIKSYLVDGVQAFQINPVPGYDIDPATVSDYYSVKYIEPELLTGSAVGLDLGSETKRRTALEFSRDNGGPVIVQNVQLYKDVQDRRGFVLLVPVYDRSSAAKTLEERRHSIKGWAFTAVVAKDFVDSAMRDQISVLSFEIQERGTNQSFYKTEDFEKSPGGSRHFYYSLPFELAQKKYLLTAYPSEKFHSARAQETSIASSMIIIIGLLLTVVMINLQLTNRRVSQQVNIRTQELYRVQAVAESHRAKSIEATRLASLGEMAGGIAHEINNPLSIILVKIFNLKSKIKKGVVDPQDLLMNLDKLESTSYRIAKIIRGMKALSHDGSTYDFELVKLSQVVEDVLDICREKFKSKGIDLQADLSENAIVRGRLIQISQVLINLLNNAEHAIENLEQPWILIKTFQQPTSVGIEVIDSGYGITDDVAARMMEPFFTTKEVGKGTGLGLSIGQSIMKDHGGTLEYVPNQPHTKFIIRFPRPT